MENFDDKYKKKNPFTVPDGYFDNLTERLMKRVGEEEKAKKNLPESIVPFPNSHKL